jgi:hypothetical protein
MHSTSQISQSARARITSVSSGKSAGTASSSGSTMVPL